MAMRRKEWRSSDLGARQLRLQAASVPLWTNEQVSDHNSCYARKGHHWGQVRRLVFSFVKKLLVIALNSWFIWSCWRAWTKRNSNIFYSTKMNYRLSQITNKASLQNSILSGGYTVWHGSLHALSYFAHLREHELTPLKNKRTMEVSLSVEQDQSKAHV